jgi:predicted transcriptional regulator
MHCIHMAASRTIPIRLDDETIERLDRIADAFSTRSGKLEIKRSAVMRLALDHGMTFLEKEYDVKPAKKKK